MKSYSITNCQVCDSKDLESILFIGDIPPVNTMLKIGGPRIEQIRFPLELCFCKNCNLTQINYIPDPNILFPPDYPYTTGTTRILRENFAQLAEEASELLGLNPEKDFIVDIGSNDGTLLSNFKNRGHNVLGIEPTDKSILANNKGINTWNEFFNDEVAKNILGQYGKPKLVTAANVFAHIPNPVDIVKSISNLIGDDGVFINESHYLLGLVENLQYDTIYHEHLRYYSLKSMIYLLKQGGLIVFRVKEIPTHGGSIRTYACKNPKVIDESVQKQLDKEDEFQLHDIGELKCFALDVLKSKVKLLELLFNTKLYGEKIFAVGAPSRGSTLLNYCGINKDLIECVVEIKGSHKIGKYMPGTNIPVLDEEILYREQPEYALLLSWHIYKELIPNLEKRGYKGDFIIPLPTPKIIKNSNNK